MRHPQRHPGTRPAQRRIQGLAFDSNALLSAIYENEAKSNFDS
jgi:hypothetical protein